MRNMIGLRKLFKVFGRGSMEFLPVENRAVLAYLRRWKDDVILCVANFSRFAQPAQLPLHPFRGYTPVEMFGYTEFPRVGEEGYPITIGGYGFYWFELTEPADLS
jgi:maltose alpha-D-glucosyltransferase/alpha-amylase